jgi:hypothetical protein
MRHYRVYVLGLNGHFINSIHLSCEDDDTALESVKSELTRTFLNSGSAGAGLRGSRKMSAGA